MQGTAKDLSKAVSEGFNNHSINPDEVCFQSQPYHMQVNDFIGCSKPFIADFGLKLCSSCLFWLQQFYNGWKQFFFFSPSLAKQWHDLFLFCSFFCVHMFLEIYQTPKSVCLPTLGCVLWIIFPTQTGHVSLIWCRFCKKLLKILQILCQWELSILPEMMMSRYSIYMNINWWEHYMIAKCWCHVCSCPICYAPWFPCWWAKSAFSID